VTTLCGIRHGTERSTQGYITYSSRLVRALVPLVPRSVVGPAALLTQQNVSADSLILGRRVEPSTPSPVVRQSSGRHSNSTPERDPFGFLGLRYPRPLEAALLVEGHDIAHGRGFYTRPSHPTDPIGGAR
jgi:hypothetical protein